MCAFYEDQISAFRVSGCVHMPNRTPGHLCGLQWLNRLFRIVFFEVAVPNKHLHDWLSSTVGWCVFVQKRQCLSHQPLLRPFAHLYVCGDLDVQVPLLDYNSVGVQEFFHDHDGLNLLTIENKRSAAVRGRRLGVKLRSIGVEGPGREVVVADAH